MAVTSENHLTGKLQTPHPNYISRYQLHIPSKDQVNRYRESTADFRIFQKYNSISEVLSIYLQAKKKKKIRIKII